MVDCSLTVVIPLYNLFIILLLISCTCNYSFYIHFFICNNIMISVLSGPDHDNNYSSITALMPQFASILTNGAQN